MTISPLYSICDNLKWFCIEHLAHPNSPWSLILLCGSFSFLKVVAYAYLTFLVERAKMEIMKIVQASPNEAVQATSELLIFLSLHK